MTPFISLRKKSMNASICLFCPTLPCYQHPQISSDFPRKNTSRTHFKATYSAPHQQDPNASNLAHANMPCVEENGKGVPP
ncbi:hypothetical protein DUNSADRAFT_12056 [Dunaliella salina]|uniref:Encoded protein n=1 Tax=Dunaliella salina TaxID=3046 RepID=A0ABQ7GC25_DUNSA|nr:hypothetical protein DUNSADRAFT_12056 [Dunaliella salina]|eukprot:KAF5832154.1 hypothetical protein DUNSADRAFT_12056 [Dunaliella salina]